MAYDPTVLPRSVSVPRVLFDRLVKLAERRNMTVIRLIERELTAAVDKAEAQ